MSTRKIQFYHNLDNIIGGYENGQLDSGKEVYPDLTANEWIEYVKAEIYDMKCDGRGATLYRNGICKDLRFLGNKYMNEAIVNEARKSGMLKE